MADLSALRDGLQDRLDTIAGLRTNDVWPDTLNMPAAIVMPRHARYEQTFGGADTLYQFDVVVMVKVGTLKAAQDQLDPYLSNTGASSIKLAIRGDSSLGGVADDVMRVELTQYSGMEHKGVDYLGAIIEVDVWAQ